MQKSFFQPAGRYSRAVLTAVMATLLLLNAHAAHAQYQVNWTKQNLMGPAARIEDGWVYDSFHQRLVMFGGYDLDGNRLNDVWEYDGAAQVWTEVTPLTGAQPAPRSGVAMAFDPVRNVVVIFGGANNAIPPVYVADTWEWSTVSKTWTNVTPATSPSVRAGARMVYDVATRQTLMMGGVDNHGYLDETWAWQAGTWTLLSGLTKGTPFLGRLFPGAAYDSDTGAIIVFGGTGRSVDGSGTGPTLDFNDTWKSIDNGITWTNVTPASSPLPRGWTQLVYDSTMKRMVMFGGASVQLGVSYGDTWSFDPVGLSWSLIAATNFAGLRDSHGMAYDTARNKTVVFGGYLADVIELTGNSWAQAIRINRPDPEDAHSMAVDTDRNVAVLYGGGALEVWELTPSIPSWTYTSLGGPNSRTGAAAAFEPISHKILLFGGRQFVLGTAGARLGDTWEWTRGPNYAWTNVTPSVSPAARDDHAMTYDAADRYPILFGGHDANGAPLGDTWLWTGTAWYNATAAGGPSPRFGAAMTYDVARGVVVLFGGDDGTKKLNDVWEWNGTVQAWHQVVAVGTSPPARSYSALSSFDASNPGVALFGGLGASAQLNDTWIWNGKRWTQASVGGAAPTARQHAGMVYDAASHRMVLYGGLDALGISGEQWIATIAGSTPPATATSPGDFDGDGKSDITVYQASTHTWYVLRSSTSYSTYGTYAWGEAGDIPVRGDFDGDGKADIATYRPSNSSWYVLLSSSNYTTYIAYSWGLAGDTPVPGDYDGDGKTDIAVYRPSNSSWYILLSSTNYTTYSAYSWGLAGDMPVPSDYDGDHKFDIAVYRPSNSSWYILLSSSNYATYIAYSWGLGGDIPVPADFDGDGKSDIAVYRPSNGGWYVLWSSTNYATFGTYMWGLSGDRPVLGDFDGDGKTDIAVYRPSDGGWYILWSSTNYTTYALYRWGSGADIALLQRP
jgi:hypothetical protein